MVRRGLMGLAWIALETLLVTAAGAASWQLAGPYGGNVWNFARSAGSPSIVYVTLLDGGFYRSADGGATWSDENATLPPGQISALAVDPTRADSVWMVLGTAPDHSGVVYHTSDGGRSWRAFSALGAVSAVAVGPGTVYVSAGGHMKRSSDGGQSWQMPAARGVAAGSRIAGLAVDAFDPRLVYATSSDLIGTFVSTDGGDSWKASTLGYTLGTLRVDPHMSGVVVGRSQGGLMRSLDRGHTFRPLGPQDLWTSLLDYAFGAGKPSDVALLVSTVPTSLLLVKGGSGSIRRLTVDAYDPAATPPVFPTVVSVNPRDSRSLLVGDTVGIRRSVDGGRSWSDASSGLGGLEAGPIAIGGRQELFAGNRRSTDAGRHWSSMLGGQSVMALAVDPTNPQRVYAGTDGAESPVWRSSNAGRTWAPASDGAFTDGLPTSLAVDPRHPSTVYLTTLYWTEDSGGLFRSTDSGATWERVNGITSNNAYQVVVEAGTPGCIRVSDDDGVERSCDGGTTWTTLLPAQYTPIASSAVAPSDPRWVYALESSEGTSAPDSLYLWRSKDSGAHFDPIALPCDPLAIVSFAVDPRAANVVYLGAQGGYFGEGLWRRRGDGPWEDISTGLPSRGVDGLLVDTQQGPRLFVSTAAGLRILSLGESTP